MPTPLAVAAPPVSFIPVTVALACPPSITTLAAAQEAAAAAFPPSTRAQLGIAIAKSMSLPSTAVTVQGVTAVQTGSRALLQGLFNSLLSIAFPQLAARSLAATFAFNLNVVVDATVAAAVFQAAAASGTPALSLASVAALVSESITKASTTGTLLAALPVSVLNNLAAALGVSPAALTAPNAFVAAPVVLTARASTTASFAFAGVLASAAGPTGKVLTAAAQGYLVDSYSGALAAAGAGAGTIISLASASRTDTGDALTLAYRRLALTDPTFTLAAVMSANAPTQAAADAIAALAASSTFVAAFQTALRNSGGASGPFANVIVATTTAPAGYVQDTNAATITGAVLGSVLFAICILAAAKGNSADSAALRAKAASELPLSAPAPAADAAPAAAAPPLPSAYPQVIVAVSSGAPASPAKALALRAADAALANSAKASPSSPAKALTLRAADAGAPPSPAKAPSPRAADAAAAGSASSSPAKALTLRVSDPVLAAPQYSPASLYASSAPKALQMDSTVARELPPAEFLTCVARKARVGLGCLRRCSNLHLFSPPSPRLAQAQEPRRRD